MDCPQIDARETAEKTETSDLFRESRPETPSSIQPVGLQVSLTYICNAYMSVK